MNKEQLEKMTSGKGFIAALDQSGGSTPKALALYGISEDRYKGEEEMFSMVHQMRTRIIKSPAFSAEYILGAILFENTMEREIDGISTPDYLWQQKGIVPFLKVDKGLADEKDGVQLMKPIADLEPLLKKAVAHNIFGTKMRSVIKAANPVGIYQTVKQQFDVGKQIMAAGLVPILEPEVDIYSENRAETEKILKEEIFKQLAHLDAEAKIMLKLSIPAQDGFYADLIKDAHVVRVVALSGGYAQQEANERLSRNQGLIASFSRALSQGLTAQQTDEQFDAMLSKSVKSIYEASIT